MKLLNKFKKLPLKRSDLKEQINPFHDFVAGQESEKADLKLNIQKTKIAAFSLITSWQIDGETMEIMTDFILLGSKIIPDGDCSHEIKRHLLLEEKLWQT